MTHTANNEAAALLAVAFPGTPDLDPDAAGKAWLALTHAATTTEEATPTAYPWTWRRFYQRLAAAMMTGQDLSLHCNVERSPSGTTHWVLPYLADIDKRTGAPVIVRLGGRHPILGDWQHRGNRYGYRTTGGQYNPVHEVLYNAIGGIVGHGQPALALMRLIDTID